MTGASRLLLVAAAVAALASAPLLLDGGSARVGGEADLSPGADAPVETCARDGVPVQGALRLRVETADGRSSAFCSVRCARAWIDSRAGDVVRVLVRDEPGGAEIDASRAVFVRSTVVASQATGERIHAFASREEAEAHAAAFGGRVLADAERPFR